MTLRDTLFSWFDRDAKKYLYALLAGKRIKGPSQPDEPLEAEQHYFRLWLNEMCLKKDRELGSSRHPLVHSLVSFQFGGSNVDIAHVAGQLTLKELDPKNLDQVVSLRHPLTTLMPFNGGVIEINAGLLAMQGDNYIQQFSKVVGDFAGLLVVPQLSSAISIAGTVASGIEQLLGAGNGRLHLGLHQSFTGKGGVNEMRPGYIAVVLTDVLKLQDRLWVVDGRLHMGDSLAGSQPVIGYTYMLFQLEILPTRDDWKSLSSIQAPYREAMKLALNKARQKEAEEYLNQAITAAYLSDDLTTADQARVPETIKAEFEKRRAGGLGAVDTGTDDLEAVMQGAMPAAQALLQGKRPLEELLL